LGGGAMAVSYVMVLCGLVLGTLLLVLGGLLSFYSVAALMRMSVRTGTESYAGLFSHCAGRRAGPILDALLFVYGNGVCVGYLVFLSDFLPALLQWLFQSGPAWIRHREFSIVVAALAVAPLCLPKDTSKLRYFSPVSIFSLLYLSLVIAVNAPGLYSAHAGTPDYGSIETVKLDSHFCEAFAICVFAFNCHLNVIPVAAVLESPTRARIVKVS